MSTPVPVLQAVPVVLAARVEPAVPAVM